MKTIDLRSDTVTRPTTAMQAAMLAAPLGDDVFGDDPTVNLLQDSLAERLGFEAGLFCPTGTQSNLIALMTHCQRGDEYIVGQEAHCYKWEAGGAAVLGSIQPQPLDNARDGSIPLERIAAAIKPDDVHPHAPAGAGEHHRRQAAAAGLCGRGGGPGPWARLAVPSGRGALF